jgi:RND superfamily putative drug exporter
MAAAPWTVRVAMFSARHRWPVAGLWFVAMVGLFVGGMAMGGTETQNAVANTDRVQSESRTAYSAFSAANVQPSATPTEASQQLLVLVTSPAQTVGDQAFVDAVGDIVARLTALRSTVDGADVPTLTDVINPLLAPPAAGLVSEDGTAIRIPSRVPGQGAAVEQRVAPIPALLESLRRDHPGFEIHALNNVLANHEIEEMVNGDLDGSLRLTIPITFAILVLAFGTLVAAFVPLVLALTALAGAFGLLAIYSQTVTAVSPYASQLIVLIGLAVAVDYSLFLLTRFRTERRAGRTNARAIEIASSTAGRAVFFSGLAVMISIAGLFILDDPFFQSMALGTIAVVLMSVVGSLTFLPATLAILDRRVDRLRVPLISRLQGERVGTWARAVRFAMRRAPIVAPLTVAALLFVATPATRLHLGQLGLESFPDTLDSVQALNALDAGWPQGTNLALDVVVTGADRPDTKAAIERLSGSLLEIGGLSGPAQTRVAADGTVAMVSVRMAGHENDLANRGIVEDVRATVVPAVFGALPDVRVYVAGDAAFIKDTVAFYEAGLPRVVAFVLGLSFLLLLIAFHSIVIPVKAILLNLVSTGAACGILVAVFQEGLFAEQLGFKPGPIESFVPVFIFTILFGLSMDYHVFILSRIQEARSAGLESAAAVERGISITAGTITSAAAIMVAVFAVFVTLRLVIIRQLGLGLAVAVLVDATIIRSLLLPATMRLLGDWNWWMPRFLDWIPRVTIEGGAEDEGLVDGPGAEPADGTAAGPKLAEEPQAASPA